MRLEMGTFPGPRSRLWTPDRVEGRGARDKPLRGARPHPLRPKRRVRERRPRPPRRVGSDQQLHRRGRAPRQGRGARRRLPRPPRPPVTTVGAAGPTGLAASASPNACPSVGPSVAFPRRATRSPSRAAGSTSATCPAPAPPAPSPRSPSWLTRARGGARGQDRHVTTHGATMRVVDYLADTIRELEPPELEIFDLTTRDPSLPGVVFIPVLASFEFWGVPTRRRPTAVYAGVTACEAWFISILLRYFNAKQKCSTPEILISTRTMLSALSGRR